MPSISTLTQLFKPKTSLVLLKVCPHHTDMILGPHSELFSRKTANNFHQAENRVYPPSSGDSIIKCRSCTYSSGKLENKSKRGIHLFKRKKKKTSKTVYTWSCNVSFCSQAGVGTKYEITPGML